MKYSVSMAIGEFFAFLGEVESPNYDDAVKQARKLCKSRGVSSYRLSWLVNSEPHHVFLTT